MELVTEAQKRGQKIIPAIQKWRNASEEVTQLLNSSQGKKASFCWDVNLPRKGGKK